METTTIVWRQTEKIVFRFFFCFFVVYVFPFPLNALQSFLFYDPSHTPHWMKWYTDLLGYYDSLMHAFIPWVAKHVLHLANPITVFTNGSGDTTYDYVTLLVFFVLSVAATLTWSIFDKRSNYSSAQYWLRVLVRYFLAINMLSYGFGKVFHLQMPSPILSELVEPFGEKSPFALAWSFVGFSKGFSAFTGMGEVVGGMLLFFRRTASLGALLLVVVLSNIVAINFCYDVPVKLYSSVLLLMSIFLLTPDVPRLLDLLYRNKPTHPYTPYVARFGGWRRILFRGLKILMIGLCVFSSVYVALAGSREYGDFAPRPHYYGIYNVQYWIKNKDTLPALSSDTTRWKRLIIQRTGRALVYLMNDSSKGYHFGLDSSFTRATMYPGQDTTQKFNLTVRADSIRLYLTGVVRNESLQIVLLKQDENKFTLVSRGFHWINEFPYYR